MSMSLAKGEVTRLTPPQGWTNDPAHMRQEYYWQGRDEDLKASLEKDYGLVDPRPLITREPKSGDVMFLLQCTHGGEDSKIEYYYVWNDIESQLCLITSPTDLKEIYERVQKSEGHLGGLELEVVEGK